MDFNTLLKEIGQKKFRPIYILHGDEPYFTERISQAIIDHALEPAQREFDQTILYGRDTEVKDLVSTVKRFPMMSPYHVVILREAQDMKKVELLEELLNQPVQSTILVMAFKKKLDGRKKWLKSLSKQGTSLLSNKLQDWKLAEWVQKASKAKNLSLDSKCTSMIAENIGGNLQRIDKDLDKLQMLTKDGTQVTPDLIQRVIGISRDYNIFELQDALMTRNALKAQRIVKHFGANPKNHPIQMVIGTLLTLYRKMIMLHAAPALNPDTATQVLSASPFYAKKVLAGAQRYTYGHLVRNISVLRDYDLKSKGVGATGATPMSELMREMVFKLTH